jgi:hypothetical protein
MNLIPYPRGLFLNPSYCCTNNVSAIDKTIQSLYSDISCLNSTRLFGQETVISTYAMLRGEINYFKTLNLLIEKKKKLKFCDWAPTGLKVKMSLNNLKKSVNDNIFEGVMLINSDSIRHLLDIQHKKYDSLY